MNYGDLLWWLMTDPVGIAVSLPLLFVQFVLAMKIHHKHPDNKVLRFLVLIWFIPQDIAVNVVAISLIGLELPQEWLVTDRMKRWKLLGRSKSGIKRWRFKFAMGLCERLNKYDAGHC